MRYKDFFCRYINQSNNINTWVRNSVSEIVTIKRFNHSKRRYLKTSLHLFQMYKLPINDELIISYDLDVNRAKIYVNHLLNLDERPDAIFAINDPTAIEAIQIIKKKKLNIPKDVAVVGFSNDMTSSLIAPPLTTMSQPVSEMGRVAARLLLHQIETDVSFIGVKIKS